MSMTLLGIGTALPPHAIAQADAADLARRYCGPDDDHARRLSVLYRRAGVDKRHLAILTASNGAASSVPFYPLTDNPGDRGPSTGERMQRYALEAGPLACRAARQALDRAGRPARAVTHLVTVSCTGFAAPGLDIGIIKELQLARTVRRAHIGFMGCHGALNGMQIGQALAEADPHACVLLCAVEVCSVHLRYGVKEEQAVASALFADGAAAAVGVAASAGPDAWRVTATGSCLVPDSEEVMTWHVGDHGFEMTLSPRVPGLIHEHLRPWLEAWLGENGVRLAEVGSWAVHPGGPRILDAVAGTLGLPARALDVSRQVLAECGNMSSPTVLFILDRLHRHAAPRPCVALGFGPGLVVEAALFT